MNLLTDSLANCCTFVHGKVCDIPMRLVVDRWRKIEHNIQAIAKTIEALRGIARWGTGDMLEAAFTGFVSLPAPPGNSWREVLGVRDPNVTAQELREAYLRAAKLAHPDRGGRHDEICEVNAAYERAKLEIGVSK